MIGNDRRLAERKGQSEFVTHVRTLGAYGHAEVENCDARRAELVPSLSRRITAARSTPGARKSSERCASSE